MRPWLPCSGSSVWTKQPNRGGARGLEGPWAQLLSLLKALFKDLQFASWQRAGCAVEALRMACASALYASADAGGSQRKRWQELYDQSNRLFNRLQAACPDGAELLEIGPSEERHPKRRDSEDTDEEDEDEDEELEERR